MSPHSRPVDSRNGSANYSTIEDFNYNTSVINTSDSNEWRRSQLLLLFSTHGVVKDDPSKLSWRGERHFQSPRHISFHQLVRITWGNHHNLLIQRHEEFEGHQRSISGDTISHDPGSDREDTRAEERPSWEEDIYRIIWHFHRAGISGIATINRLVEDQHGNDSHITAADHIILAMSEERMNEVLREAQRRMETDPTAGQDPPNDNASERRPYWCREWDMPLRGHQCPVTVKYVYRQVIRHGRGVPLERKGNRNPGDPRRVKCRSRHNRNRINRRQSLVLRPTPGRSGT